MKDNRSMTYWQVAALASSLLLVGCTKANPRSCKDGTCTDPAYPFCDTDGSLAGTAQTCITVDCTPAEFQECRGDKTALTCNAEGTDYDSLQCAHGCDESSGGCLLCDPNATACTNGKVATCDAEGQPTVTEICALGCFEDQPRCREMVPANNLGPYLSLVADPPDLELTEPLFDTSTGNVTVGGQIVSVPSFVLTSTSNGSDIRVFVVGTLRLHSAHATAPLDTTAFPAIAFVARDSVAIDGEFVVDRQVGFGSRGCNAPSNGSGTEQTPARLLTYAGGGGGNGTSGGAGGGIGSGPGPAAGDASGTATLVPLRGGCNGGYAYLQRPGDFPGGGGAVQISAAQRITIDATIDVRGGKGGSDSYVSSDQSNLWYYVGGGGGGGSVLLDAPTVDLGPDAHIDGRGGDGSQACATPSMECGSAGLGATAQHPATDGMSVAGVGASNFAGGGGGGGLGRLRVNTATGAYTKAGSVVEDAAVSTGTVQSR